jgi:DNA polymerase-3 subunit delta
MMDTSKITFLYGTDEYAIAQETQKWIQAMGPSSTADLNITRLDGRNFSMDAFHTAANAVPFLSERRLVILEHAHSAFKGVKELKKLSEFLQNLPSTTTLGLIEYLDLHDNFANKNFYEWLHKLTGSLDGKFKIQTLECIMPGLRKLPDWIIQETIRQAEAIQKPARFEPSAAARLAEMVGEDTRIAAQEIAKLLEYVNFARNITLQDVDLVSVVSAQQDVFVLVDALGHKNGQKAQKILLQLLQDEESFSIWGMVIRQFRLLLQTREVLDAGGRQAEIVQEMHVAPFVAGKLAEQARRFDMPGLETIYHRLLDLDESIKTGQMSIELALELFVVELC